MSAETSRRRPRPALPAEEPWEVYPSPSIWVKGTKAPVKLEAAATSPQPAWSASDSRFDDRPGPFGGARGLRGARRACANEALVTEATQFGGGLGEVIIAHTLIANSKTPVTMDQIFTLRKDGMGWGQIAQGMNLRVGDVVSAVMSEGKVAYGTVKTDGKTAMIHSGSTQASTHAGLGANVKAGHTGT